MTTASHTMSIRELSGLRATIECDCGWEGKPVDVETPDDYAVLEDQWTDHCDQVFMAATGGA